MANIKTVKDLMAAIRETERTTKAYDTTATVTRVAGSTAWVHIPGGVDETPVMKSIDAKAGDEVNVRVSGGKAWITGNNTSPPTNDTEVVQQIYKIANNAKKQAAEADEAALNSISEDIIHYLATTLDSGVTIDTPGWTETPQSIDSTNRYLWTYHSYVLANGNTLDTDPVISGVYGDKGEQGDDGDKGDKGDKGDTGKGISAVQPQYYLSTSSSYLAGGSWSTSLTYSSGYYIWTRDKITYDDNTVSYSTAIYNQALTEACSLSYNTAQYFWVQDSASATTDVPTGAYVTELDQDSYKTNPRLGSLLLRSAGIYIRLAAVTIAQFLSSGLTLFSSAGNKLAEFLSSGTILYAGDNNNTEVATFSSNKIELGKNSDSSSIEMCGARASIYTTRLTYGSTTTLQAKNVFDLEDATTQLTEAALQAIHQKGRVWSSASIYCHADANNSVSKVQLFADYVQANGSEVVTEAKASSSAPNMDGTASAGSSTYYARADHVHPTDTSRASSTHTHSGYVPTSRKINGNALSGDVTLSYSDVGAASSSHSHNKASISEILQTTFACSSANTWCSGTALKFTLSQNSLIMIDSTSRFLGAGVDDNSNNTAPQIFAYGPGTSTERTPLFYVKAGTYYVHLYRTTTGTVTIRVHAIALS